MSKVKEYQKKVGQLLERRIQQKTVSEWWSDMGHGIYTPRVDIATGPFAIEVGIHKNWEHGELLHQHQDFFRDLVAFHLENLHLVDHVTAAEQRAQYIAEKMNLLFSTNQNARCFVALEIENKVSRKHLMGGAVNCSVLGKVGIAIGFDEEKHQCLLNLYRYFDFLRRVDKPTFNTSNLLIVSKDQLIEALSA